jgi:hypothetical protein
MRRDTSRSAHARCLAAWLLGCCVARNGWASGASNGWASGASNGWASGASNGWASGAGNGWASGASGAAGSAGQQAGACTALVHAEVHRRYTSSTQAVHKQYTGSTQAVHRHAEVHQACHQGTGSLRSSGCCAPNMLLLLLGAKQYCAAMQCIWKELVRPY